MTEKTPIRFDAESIEKILSELKADKNGHIRGNGRVIDQIQSLHLQSIEPQEPENTDKCNINGFTGECVKCPIHKTCEDYTGKIQPKEISVTDKEVTYMTYFPSKDQIRNMALDIVGYNDDQPQLITQEMAVNFITIFAKWMRDKLKANG